MSDELPETPDRAIRLWLAVIGATLVLVGGEMMAEKDGARFGIGLALVLVALPVHLAWAFWQRIKPRLGSVVIVEIGTIATSPRWWFGLLLVLLSALIFAPVIQVPRWPTLPFSRTELTTIPTMLRLQFNASGTKPEEIERHNLNWTWSSFQELREKEPTKKYLCEPSNSDSLNLGANPLGANNLFGNKCSFFDFPNYDAVTNIGIFLAFERSISAKNIKLNSHGATLPKWEISFLSNQIAYLRFRGDLVRMILDVQVVN